MQHLNWPSKQELPKIYLKSKVFDYPMFTCARVPNFAAKSLLRAGVAGCTLEMRRDVPFGRVTGVSSLNSGRPSGRPSFVARMDLVAAVAGLDGFG